jgi:hypothetical protein
MGVDSNILGEADILRHGKDGRGHGRHGKKEDTE